MLDEVVNSGFVNDSQRTLLKDVLNPATHGDALVNVGRIGSFAAQDKNWALYLSMLMNELTHNFVILIRELAGIDLEAVAGKHAAAAQQE
jgi:succinyl-CoA synthetase beta subunit